MSSLSDCSTQTTPSVSVDETNGLATVPSKMILDMVDKLLGRVSLQTVVNSTVPIDSLSASNEKILSLSELKILQTQLGLALKSIQARSEDRSSKDY